MRNKYDDIPQEGIWLVNPADLMQDFVATTKRDATFAEAISAAFVGYIVVFWASLPFLMHAFISGKG